MKSVTKRIRMISFVLAALLIINSAGVLMVQAADSSITSTIDASKATLNNDEIVDASMEWKYYDGDEDPNSGTWFAEWRKRNGWAYPIGWLDGGADGGTDMEFSDKLWQTYRGTKFSTDTNTDGQVLATTKDGKAKSTYFLRHTFTLTQAQAESVYAIKIRARYNDAMILYINGKPVGDFHNIPLSNYSSNLEYGCQDPVDDGTFIEETFLVEDASCITGGFVPGKYETYYDEAWKMDLIRLTEPATDNDDNTFMNITIAVELHAASPEDAEANFELMEFVLNPDESNLPTQPDIRNIAVNVGEDESALNLTWNSLSDKTGYVQIAEGTDASAFSSANVKEFPATSPVLAYTKFTATDYYSNKATIKVDRNKNYVYRVGNDDGWSETYPLSTQGISDGYEIIFLSDAQIGTGTIPTDTLGWATTLGKAFDEFPDTSFIVNTGDFIDVANKESEYDAYFTPEVLLSYPTATAVGNHDVAVNYGNHFNEPNASTLGASSANSDYYFTYGNVLYMVLNTSNANNTEHVQFMNETMAATANQEFDWTVVMFHQSIYASGKQSTYEGAWNRQKALVPVFDELGIDIVLMGHDHCYARTYQMYNFVPVADVTYNANGAAVAPEGTLYLTTSSASGSKYYDLVEDYEYLAYREQSYVPTFSHLTFTEDTFTMAAYRTDTMEVFDSYSITKTADTPPPVAKADLSTAVVSGVSGVNYTGKAITFPKMTVQVKGATLALNTDYTVSYINNTNAGTATVTITAADNSNYTGSISKNFNIAKISMNPKVTAYKGVYDGKKHNAVAISGVPSGSTTTYKVNSGSYKTTLPTIKAAGVTKVSVKITNSNYDTYEKTYTITIKPKRAVISSVKSNKAGKLTVKWKKDTAVTGYQVQRSTTNKFTKKTTSGTRINKNGTVTKTFSKLTKGKKYFVRVRAYKTVKINGKNVTTYGSWSKVKNETVKKK